MINRRSFLTRSGLAAAGASAAVAPHIARSADALLTAPGQKPKRIIHIVSDGMSIGTLTCANLFSQQIRKRPLAWTELYKNPAVTQAMMNTRSLNSMVTDSSAASSAWGSGSRVVNGALNILPNGTALTPFYKLFAQAGWKTGLVTTAEITHATPAGFAVAVKSRGDSQAIAAQYFDRKVDVLLGGGRPFFEKKSRKDKRDLQAEFRDAGYTVVNEKAELEKAPVDKPILGTFSTGHLPYTLDQINDPKIRGTKPSLADMTRFALAHLGRFDHFILQVEGARVDHAAHNSDAAAAIHDQIALDEAIELCLAYQRDNPDTLIVITTDHANSNLGLNGMGGGYRTSSQRFATLAQVKSSFPEILKRIEKAGKKIKVPSFPGDPEDRVDVPDPMAKIDPTGKSEGEDSKDEKDGDTTKFTAAVKLSSALDVAPKDIVSIIADATGYKTSLRRATLFAKVLSGEYPALFDQMNSPVTQLGQLIANRIGIGWTGNTHTSDYVTFLALGPGSERFRGFVENTDVFIHYTALAGIDFKNPSAPYIASAGPEADEVEHSAAYAYA